jgi:transformation/transcription domain-associated protein
MVLLLEQLALDGGNTHSIKAKKDQPDCYEFEPSTSATIQNPPGQHQEVMDSLAELYASLKEEDLWAGLWQRKAKYAETNIGIAFQQQGFYEKAQGAFELAMNKAKSDFVDEGCSGSVFPEFKLWEEQWLK